MAKVRLLLIRHSNSQIEESVPAHRWQLSDLGRQRCALLAEQLRLFAPSLLLSSNEPKAIETACLATKGTGLLTEVVPGLGEHDRTGVPFLGQKQFVQQVARLFAEPESTDFGGESAAAALKRFEGALRPYLAGDQNGPVAAVSHGTVMTLFAAGRGATDPLHLWRSLTMPAIMLFRGPELSFDRLITFQ